MASSANAFAPTPSLMASSTRNAHDWPHPSVLLHLSSTKAGMKLRGLEQTTLLPLVRCRQLMYQLELTRCRQRILWKSLPKGCRLPRARGK